MIFLLFTFKCISFVLTGATIATKRDKFAVLFAKKCTCKIGGATPEDARAYTVSTGFDIFPRNSVLYGKKLLNDSATQ